MEAKQCAIKQQKKWIPKEIKEEIKKYPETNGSMMIQNLWDTAKAVLRKKFPDIQVSLKRNTEVPDTTSSEPLLPS